MVDPYQILGVTKNSSDEEIKKNYRTLSRRYHPDANINNPNKAQAEEKFKQIQTAYQKIMKERTEGYDSSSQQDNGSWYDPFGFGSSAKEDRTTEEDETDMLLKAASNYINSGHFREGLNTLGNITHKNALWYYYSSVANSGLGNNVVALEHAKKAVAMDPNNIVYRRLVEQLEYGGSWYQTKQQRYGGGIGLGNNLCLKLCVAELVCSMCCGGGGFCFGNNNSNTFNYNNSYGSYGSSSNPGTTFR